MFSKNTSNNLSKMSEEELFAKHNEIVRGGWKENIYFEELCNRADVAASWKFPTESPKPPQKNEDGSLGYKM